MKKAIVMMAMLVSIHSNPAAADYMTSEQFSKFTEEQKHWWFFGAFTNIGHIASTQYDKKKTECVFNWYFQNPERRERQLGESFKSFPEYTPSTVILALLRRDCGVFKKEN